MTLGTGGKDINLKQQEKISIFQLTLMAETTYEKKTWSQHILLLWTKCYTTESSETHLFPSQLYLTLFLLVTQKSPFSFLITHTWLESHCLSVILKFPVFLVNIIVDPNKITAQFISRTLREIGRKCHFQIQYLSILL